MMIRNLLFVAFGGALGSVVRYVVSRSFSGVETGGFPLATFVVNVVGCLILGFVSTLAAREGVMSETVKVLITVGFCGGLTTFSTFCNESVGLMRPGTMMLAAVYAGASIALGFMAVWGGSMLARQIG